VRHYQLQTLEHDLNFQFVPPPTRGSIRMIAGLEELTSGEIDIGGTVVNDLPSRARDIAMVFQDYALDPHQTVFENMAFGLRLRQAAATRDRRARGRGGHHPADHASAAAQAARAVRGPAAARGDGALDRAQAQGVSVRRAAVEPRRAAPRRDARRKTASSTLSVGITHYQGKLAFPWPLISAALIIAIVPICTLIAVFQERVVGGLTSGA
jgi:ABC-type sugar transport system ATPase subunit